ncbi:cyclin-domain-containing protein [Lineolata rhizophorae]|uniref:Cyclin-domain-containing protein n=1 Tax=Lineolata rhizophorae TaxID=578093 RepID=A0A6A6PDZ0_9PEZI|nr:cyclin-domain-containing protein [Lineolata rhizophorae]
MIHLPKPMPHAVPLDAPVDVFPPQSFATTKQPPAFPPPYRFASHGQALRPDLHACSRSSSVAVEMRAPEAVANGTYSHYSAYPHAAGIAAASKTNGVPEAHSDAAHYGSTLATNASSSRTAADSTRYLRNFTPNGVASRTQSPVPQRAPTAVPDSTHRKKPSSSAIAPYFQIPPTIDTPQGSIAHLAAEITCLFWFENSSTLTLVEKSGPQAALSVVGLAADAIPTTGFKKWVTTILTTTQVAQNVILLALLFIYRLKKINPAVKGKQGSEYRLLTVALMLGNKFLDDNTYTNKTWAEVSGISVQEVHIMEVEFLSNMKYNLYTSEAEWQEWHQTLGKFGTFFDKASRPSQPNQQLMGPATPTLHAPPSLPSPPTSNHASPPFPATYSPNVPMYTQTPQIQPQANHAVVSPIGSLPEPDPRARGRKRSVEDPTQETPSKKVARGFYPPHSATSGPSVSASQPTTLPRLPLPSLPMPNGQLPAVSQAPQQFVPQLLPPPGGRAMSLVYPPPTQFPQQPSMPGTVPPVQSVAPQPAPINTLGDHQRQLSPYPNSSNHSSPITINLPPSTAQQIQPQNRLSPSYFLAQRNSPYRPVRGVTTLLVPPPSSSMNHPPRPLGFEQMQYQSLGRPFAERRVGQLPYTNLDAWPESNQFNQLPALHPANARRS